MTPRLGATRNTAIHCTQLPARRHRQQRSFEAAAPCRIGADALEPVRRRRDCCQRFRQTATSSASSSSSLLQHASWIMSRTQRRPRAQSRELCYAKRGGSECARKEGAVPDDLKGQNTWSELSRRSSGGRKSAAARRRMFVGLRYMERRHGGRRRRAAALLSVWLDEANAL